MYQRRRPRAVLVVLVLVALVLITVDFRTGGSGRDGPLDRLRGAVTTVLRPIQEGVATVVRPVGDAVGSVTDIFSVRADNQRLRDRLATLEERRRSVTDLERENEELRALLEFRERGQLETIAATTIGNSPSNFEWVIVIDVGADDGVRPNMPVVNGDGLVGKVIQVEARASRVMLAIDPNFFAAAQLAASGETGPVNGRGGDPLSFQPLDPEIEIEVGMELVTSSYDHGLYPAGIPIGTVAEASEPSTSLQREVLIRPFVDFTRLHQLLVVVNAPVDPIPPFEDSPEAEFRRPDVAPFLEPEDGTPADDEDDA